MKIALNYVDKITRAFCDDCIIILCLIYNNYIQSEPVSGFTIFNKISLNSIRITFKRNSKSLKFMYLLKYAILPETQISKFGILKIC